jgi:hypothetical protein
MNQEDDHLIITLSIRSKKKEFNFYPGKTLNLFFKPTKENEVYIWVYIGALFIGSYSFFWLPFHVLV